MIDFGTSGSGSATMGLQRQGADFKAEPKAKAHV